MPNKVTDSEIDDFMSKLMPVLTRAIQGDFSGRIKMKHGDRLNEVYAGIQTMLDIINEQIKILDELSPDKSSRYSLSNRKSSH